MARPGRAAGSPRAAGAGLSVLAAKFHALLLRIDHFDYLLTLARLRILEVLAGPLPETPAD